MSAYRKLVAAVIGVAILLLNEKLGLDLSGQEQALVDTAIAALTAFGVWAVPNEEKV